MKRSTRELVLKALGELQLFEVGQQVPSENYATVKDCVSGLLGALRGSRVLDLFVNPADEDSQDIPDYAFDGLAIALANAAASDFGLPKDLNPSRPGGAWQHLKDTIHVGAEDPAPQGTYY